MGEESCILRICRGHGVQVAIKSLFTFSKTTMPAVNLIATPPTFISQDEHTTLVGSTPNSFNDIPPVIRHKEEGVTVTLEPQLDGFSNVQGTLYVLTRSAAFNSKHFLNNLLFFRSVLAFVSTTGAGFQIEYPAITLHAVSRAESGPSIYCQLDESFGQANGAPSTNDEDSEMRELTIVPKSSDSCTGVSSSTLDLTNLHFF